MKMKWAEWTAVADDPTQWQNHHERGLLKVEHQHDFVLRLWFEEELDVTIYELDFYSLFVTDNPGGVFGPLANIARFRMAKGDYALVWLNPQTGAYDEFAVDIAPECVRFFCETYGKKLKPSHREVIAS